MNFNVFKAARPKKIVGRSIYRNRHTISEVINNARIEDLEVLVIKNFEDILGASASDEYHYFTMYKSWKMLFIKYSSELFEELECYYEFEDILENFPELEADVYRFLLNGCLTSSINDYLRDQIYITNDILYPMLYMERYSGVKFPEIHEKIMEIIDAATTYSEFYSIISFYRNELEIPDDVLDPIVTHFLEKDIEKWTSGQAQTEDFDSLPELFQYREAYELFMNSLCKIFRIYGLNLYVYLVKHIGPLPEILAREYCCYEFCEK